MNFLPVFIKFKNRKLILLPSSFYDIFAKNGFITKFYRLIGSSIFEFLLIKKFLSIQSFCFSQTIFILVCFQRTLELSFTQTRTRHFKRKKEYFFRKVDKITTKQRVCPKEVKTFILYGSSILIGG